MRAGAAPGVPVGDPRSTTGAGPRLSIGEVLAQLRPEFPDVTISKLRFLEAEGLVEPLRTPAGYRKYTPEHLSRLRFVLTAQRDRYLPLRVIREHLAATDRGERVVGLPVPGLANSDDCSPKSGDGCLPDDSRLAAAERRSEVGDVRLTRVQLAERAGLGEAEVAELEQYGLLVPADAGHYTGEALTVARLAAALTAYGLQARHLRPYRATADREVGLLAQLVLPVARHSGSGGGVDRALETVHELAALCAQLHAALVRQGLRDVLRR
jgi:DNA-binding transcriptional MerR regulator